MPKAELFSFLPETGQIKFSIDILLVQAEGQFTAKYKFTLIPAIANICVKNCNLRGRVLKVTIQDLVRQFVTILWRQAVPSSGYTLYQQEGKTKSVNGSRTYRITNRLLRALKSFAAIFLIVGIVGLICSCNYSRTADSKSPKNGSFENSALENPYPDDKSQLGRAINGQVVKVQDGDTITILDEYNIKRKIRLAGIDAPESAQEFGKNSKEHLSNLIFGRDVTVITSKLDRNKRFIGKVLLSEVDINLEQIKAGMAWHFKKYAGEQDEVDRRVYAEAETNARIANTGLWSFSQPVPPWDWRERKDSPNLEGVPEGAIIGNTSSNIFHTPGCSTYAKVSPRNRILFNTIAEAESSGYHLAKNCSL